jgi:D-glycero-alpha-D-manno-heptose-7-phosphate kinase
MIITRTPYRLSMFGGGTDYPAWFSKRPGRLVSAAIDYHCYISVRNLPPFFEHSTRVVYSKIEAVKDLTELQHPVVRACLQHLSEAEGLEIHYDGDLPARSGIGSSSSFTVGLLLALHAYRGSSRPPSLLAKDAIYIEQQLLREHVGIQDQITAAYGGLRLVDMGPDDDWTCHPLVVSREYREYFESHVLLGYSGVSRTAEEFSREKVSNIQAGRLDAELTEASEIAKEAIHLMESSGCMEALGKLLNVSWQLKRRMSSALSEQAFHNIIAIGLKHGAWGGKLMGAGGGGFFYFLAPPARHDTIKIALPQIKVWVPFRIDRAGAQVIFQS